MKKLLSVFLCLLLLFTMAACSSGESSGGDAEEQSSPQNSENPQATDGADNIEVEENLFTVELTIPASFIDEDTTQATLDETAANAGYKTATLNDDGSVTYVMTKAQHEELMNEICSGIDEALLDMIDPDTYPTFQEISANSDYTEFTVTLNAEEVGFMESFSVLAFYMYGGMYHAFNGTEVDDIVVQFVSANTGDIIEEFHSSEAE